MATRLRQSRRYRGHRNHGNGRVGGHTKHPSGSGKAGGLQFKRTHFDKYHPGYFGKLGMRNYHVHANQNFCAALNLNRVWALIPEDQKEKFLAAKSTTAAPVVDVTKFGFFKVIGRGELPQCPIIIKARSFSRDAEKKIKAAGGVPVLVP